MKTYLLYVQDERYAAPSLMAVEMPDDDKAQAFARRTLDGSPHYQGIEIWDDDRMVAVIAAEKT